MKTLTSAMDNLDAWRLGEVAREAMGDHQKAGDLIDRGLILRRLLEEKGYGIVKLPDSAGESRDATSAPRS